MARLNKHNARRHTATVGGQLCHFDSMAERRYAEYLERKGVNWQHHPKPMILLGCNGGEVGRIAPDFLVVAGKGQTHWHEFHEVKGMATAVWRLKRRLFEDQHGAGVYVVIDAGRGVCATGTGAPALFDERPRRKRKARAKK